MVKLEYAKGYTKISKILQGAQKQERLQMATLPFFLIHHLFSVSADALSSSNFRSPSRPLIQCDFGVKLSMSG